MEVKRPSKYRFRVALATLLLLALALYGFLAWQNRWFPFAGEPGPTPPPEKTLEEKFAEWLDGQDLDEDVKEALWEQGVNHDPPVFSFREKEVKVTCEKEDETASGSPTQEYLWLKIEGTDPRLLCANIFDWKEGEPLGGFDRGVRFEMGGKTYYPDTADLYTGKDFNGLCHLNVRSARLLGEVHPVLLDKDENGNYIMEDGYYRITVTHDKGYGPVGISPEWIYVGYDENAEESFHLYCTWSEGEVLDYRLGIVVFEKKSGGSGGGGGGGGHDPSPGPGGDDPDPGPGDSHKCCNKEGCERSTIHCKWCRKWHCLIHICEKRWAYNFWCDNQTGDYDLSSYQRAYDHFVNGSGAANYQRWIPEFEAFGVHYEYDWYDD